MAREEIDRDEDRAPLFESSLHQHQHLARRMSAECEEESYPLRNLQAGPSRNVRDTHEQEDEVPVFRRPKWYYRHRFWLLQVVLIALYTITAIEYVRWTAFNNATSTSASSPLDMKAAEREERKFTTTSISNYTGAPTAAIDQAWTALMQPSYIRMSAGEMLVSKQLSVALPDGGYLAQLSSVYQLQCAHRVRMWLYKGSYHQNMTAEGAQAEFNAVEGCLEVLRQAVECAGDASLVVFDWNSDKLEKNTTNTFHYCVHTQSMLKSYAARNVSSEEMARLKPPS